MAKIALLFGYGQSADGELLFQTLDRCLLAIGAYHLGKINKIYITCHVNTNGIMMQDKMREYIVDCYVKKDDVIVIPKGTNTAGEIDTFLEAINPKEHKIFGISSSYHLPRIKYLFWARNVHVAVIGNWESVSWKDLRIEPIKMLNSFLRPFSSSKRIP